MRFSIIFCLLLFSSCRHIGLLFEPPGTLKAVVEGEIRGMAIHCEKTISLGSQSWEVMCKVKDDIDIKYRTQSINSNQIKLELMINKQTGDTHKIIAAPVMIVSRGKPARIMTVSEKGRIDIKAEPADE